MSSGRYVSMETNENVSRNMEIEAWAIKVMKLEAQNRAG